MFVQNFRRWLCWILMLLGGSALIAPVVASTSSQLAHAPSFPLPLGLYSEVLEDASGSLTLDDVLNGPQQAYFQPLAEQSFNAGMTRSSYWVRVTIPGFLVDQLRSQPARYDSGGEWSRFPALLEYNAPFVDYLDVYYLHQGAVVDVWQMGDRKPFSERPYNSAAYVVPLQLSANGDQHLLIHIRNQGLVIGLFNLWTPETYAVSASHRNLLFGLFYGAIVIMALYNLFIFISIRDISYLYYVFAISAIALFEAVSHGHAFQFLWPDYPVFANLATPLSVFASVFFMLVFVRHFLQLSRDKPGWVALFRSLEGGSLLAVVATFYVDYMIMVNISILFAVLSCLFVLSVSWERFRAGEPSAGYFLLAWLILIVSVLFAAAMRLFPIPVNLATLNVVSFGLLAEVLLISLALAARFNHLQAEAKALLKRGMADLRESNTVKDQFLATISHELRTPMNGVEGALSLLDRDQLTAVDRVYLDTAIHSAAEMTRLVDAILRFTEMQAGSVLIKAESFNPVVFLAPLISEVEDRCLDKSIKFKAQLPGAGMMLQGDTDQIRLIVSQLCDNAIKFTPRDGRIELAVTLEPGDGGALLAVEVADTGIGIDQETQSRLFEPFRAKPGSTSLRRGGLGIGLSLCQYLAHKMGGDLSVAPQTQGGTVARLTLRLRCAPQQRLESLTGVEDCAPGKQILVAEDNPVNQKVLLGILKKLGHEVTVVDNGQQAVDALAKQPFDMVFMDCQMPVMDGYEATRRLREGAFPDGPIIAVTANAMSTDKEKCLRNGMNDYLAKPVKLDQIRTMIRRWCRS